MEYIRTAPKKNNSYPLYITSENKDAIIDLMIENAKEDGIICLEYNSLNGNPNISKGQYEAIIREFIDLGLIERCGSKTGSYGYKFRLLCGIYSKKERGGYCVERDAYMSELKNIQLQLEKVEKDLSPSAIDKINSIISKMNNVSDLISNIGGIREIIRQFLPTQ